MYCNDLLKWKGANKLEKYLFNYISCQIINKKKRKFLIPHVLGFFSYFVR